MANDARSQTDAVVAEITWMIGQWRPLLLERYERTSIKG
jgi:hypothetical protein